MKVSFFIAWYDAWVGVFVDTKKRVVYICPLPCCVIKIEPLECVICHGKGFVNRWRHSRQNTDACQVCLTTGLKSRWLIWLKLRRMAWVDGYVPQFHNDQFNPMLYPPMPWTCRKCNGVGADYDGYDVCSDCDGVGLRWRFMEPVILWYYKGYSPIRDWWQKRKEKPGEDEIPF